MITPFESFLDATPEKGVIAVEYYWQPPHDRPHSTVKKDTRSHRVADKTSMIFFRRILASDKCWCGNGRAFSRCHRRVEDWTYVTLNPDQHAYSPVVLLEHTFHHAQLAQISRNLITEKPYLHMGYDDERVAWALPAHPQVENDIGQLIIGTLEITPRGLRLETNSELRLEHILRELQTRFGNTLGKGDTRRSEPQKTFNIPVRKKR